MRKKLHPVESALICLCEERQIAGIHIEILVRLIIRSKYSHLSDLERLYKEGFFVNHVWRAFYDRHPQKMLNSFRRPIRHLARNYRARDQAAEAMKAMNKVLDEHEI